MTRAGSDVAFELFVGQSCLLACAIGKVLVNASVGQRGFTGFSLNPVWLLHALAASVETHGLPLGIHELTNEALCAELISVACSIRVGSLAMRAAAS